MTFTEYMHTIDTFSIVRLYVGQTIYTLEYSHTSIEGEYFKPLMDDDSDSKEEEDA